MARLISPVAELILSPAVDVNIPPIVNPVAGIIVGFISLIQMGELYVKALIVGGRTDILKSVIAKQPVKELLNLMKICCGFEVFLKLLGLAIALVLVTASL